MISLIGIFIIFFSHFLDANSLLETTMLKGLPGNHQSLPEGHYQQQQTSWQQQQAAGATTSLEQLQDSYNRLSDNISQG